jgi:hypothetical protein
MRKSITVVIAACGALCIALIAGIYTFVSLFGMPGDDIGPWYGRAKHLPRMPYSIVVGPVDATRGVSTVLELGMTKSELHSSLGKPLVPALSKEKTLEMCLRVDLASGASLDPSSFTNEFYGGVFAWVSYDEHGRVGLIWFDPAAFRKQLGGAQRIIVSCHGRTLVLGENTSRGSFVRVLDQSHPRLGFDMVGGTDLRIRGTNLRVVFRSKARNSKLKYVSIVGKAQVM